MSEELIAEALHPYPDDLVIATKGGLTRPGPGSWQPDCRPERLKKCCEASLRRLKLDTIDLYQLHTADPKVPFEESVGALAELRDEGKVRHVGLSNVGRSHIDAAQEIVPIVSVQNRYSLTARDSEEVLQKCEQEGLGFIPWFPLDAGGIAQGRARGGRARATTRRRCRSRSPGCSRTRRRCCRSRARPRSRTSRRTSRPRR